MSMKLSLIHRETKEYVVEYSGKGIPLTKLISPENLSFSLLYEYTPQISSYLSENTVTKKYSNICPYRL